MGFPLECCSGIMGISASIFEWLCMNDFAFCSIFRALAKPKEIGGFADSGGNQGDKIWWCSFCYWVYRIMISPRTPNREEGDHISLVPLLWESCFQASLLVFCKQ